MYSLCFNKAVEFTLAMEGSTNYHLNDRGGLTKYGISSKQYPDLDIANLSFEAAISIYHKDYWLDSGCSHFADPLAIVVFDTGVNCGVHSVGKWLQTTLVECGSDVAVDGIVGNETVTAAVGHNPRILLEGVISYRLLRYTGLVKKYPDQAVFIQGWVNRAAALLQYVRSDHASHIGKVIN